MQASLILIGKMNIRWKKEKWYERKRERERERYEEKKTGDEQERKTNGKTKIKWPNDMTKRMTEWQNSGKSKGLKKDRMTVRLKD